MFTLSVVELTCCPDLSDRLQVANQHAQTRHTTLSTAMSTRQFKIVFFCWIPAHRRGQVDRTRVREKNFPNTWTPSHFFWPYVCGRSILPRSDTLIDSAVTKFWFCIQNERTPPRVYLVKKKIIYFIQWRWEDSYVSLLITLYSDSSHRGVIKSKKHKQKGSFTIWLSHAEIPSPSVTQRFLLHGACVCVPGCWNAEGRECPRPLVQAGRSAVRTGHMLPL